MRYDIAYKVILSCWPVNFILFFKFLKFFDLLILNAFPTSCICTLIRVACFTIVFVWITPTFTVCLSLPVSFPICDFSVSSCALFSPAKQVFSTFTVRLLWWCCILLPFAWQENYFSLANEWEPFWVACSWL